MKEEHLVRRYQDLLEIARVVSWCMNRDHLIKTKAIFAEPQFSPKAAAAVAEECGARVLLLNPLGQPPDYRYINMMRYNLSEITQALR
jgi:ABC-type Zn2+ transport system substrate-binding protein/surface adhesin